jgi:hypothetical protein
MALYSSMACATAVNEIEPNSARAQAQSLNAGLDVVVSGKMPSATDADYYKVASVPSGECLTFLLQPNPSSNYNLSVSNSAGTVLGSSSNGTGQIDNVVVCNVSGAVYAHVRYVSGLAGASGTYTLEATF